MKKLYNFIINNLIYLQFSSPLIFATYIYRKFTKYENIKFNSYDLDESFIISKSDGYKIIKFKNFEFFNQMISSINNNLNNNFYFKNNPTNAKKNFMHVDNIELSNKNHSLLLDFIKKSGIIRSISNYLEAPPILIASQIWKSKKNENDDDYMHSQLYHFDREDWKQIKCFIPVKKIDLNSGPLNIISVKNTKLFKLKSLFRFHIPNTKARYDDAYVSKLISVKPKPLLADIGEILLVDTSQCLHFGSRVNTSERLVIVLQFVSPYSTKLDNKKIKKIKSFNNIEEFSLQLI